MSLFFITQAYTITAYHCVSLSFKLAIKCSGMMVTFHFYSCGQEVWSYLRLGKQSQKYLTNNTDG